MSHELPPDTTVADSVPVVTQPVPNAEKRSTSSRAASYIALLLIAAIGGAALFMSGFMLGRLNGQTPGTSDANQELFRPFWDAYNDVSTRYVGEVDPHFLVEGAIKGIFEALGDPFSSVPDRRGVPRQPRWPVRSVRGRRHRNGHARERGGMPADLGHLPPDDHARHSRLAGNRGGHRAGRRRDRGR